MAKHDRRKTSGQPPSSRPVTIQVPLPVLGVVNGVREAFHGLCIATGLQVLQAMMEVDREVLCGPKGRHQVERPAWRGGSVDSQVTLGGRQVELPRLRVRSADGEVPLASFQWAAATDPLDEHTLAAVAAGVSTRRYAGTLDPVPADVTERATSSSAVSRRFVALSTKRLQAFLGRPLGELDLRAVCIDGKVFRDHCMVIALGIDTQGRKHVLGLREGATETAAVTTGLLSDLVTRGMPTDRTLLFVIDGATGLRRAITDVFGSRGVVQRCQVHNAEHFSVGGAAANVRQWQRRVTAPVTEKWIGLNRYPAARLWALHRWQTELAGVPRALHGGCGPTAVGEDDREGRSAAVGRGRRRNSTGPEPAGTAKGAWRGVDGLVTTNPG